MPIESPRQLREHIELAMKVELSTVPPYLYAMYSLEDPSSDPGLLIRSIVAEEMLHLALATNLLLAVGGAPEFATTRYMPTYPMELPHHIPPLNLDLSPLSPELIRNVLMRIEQPQAHHSPPEPDEFETLGQFYHALEQGVETVAIEHDVFADPRVDSQLSDHNFYQPVAFAVEGSGGLVGITDVASAKEAMEIIIHQGEGVKDERWADPDHQELTHFYKLLQIVDGEYPLGPVRRLPTNPRSADYPDDLRAVSDLFNAVYRSLYLVMDQMFQPGDQGRWVGVLYLLMGDVLSQLAHFLVSQPLESTLQAAPTFEIFEFESDSPLEEIKGMSESVARRFPELAPVQDAVKGLTLIV